MEPLPVKCVHSPASLADADLLAGTDTRWPPRCTSGSQRSSSSLQVLRTLLFFPLQNGADRLCSKLPIGEDDVLYFFEEIHRARSVAPPYSIPSQPSMMRWRKDRGLDWDNIVVFERDEGNL